MFIRDFFTENYVMIFELIGLLIILTLSVSISSHMKKLTRAAVVLMFAETVFFYAEKWTQSFTKLSILRPMLTAAIYSIYPIIMVLIMQITTEHTLSSKSLLLLLIPEFISVPVFFTSYWTHLVFTYSDENMYGGSDYGLLLGYWPYILFAFYAVVFIIINIRYFRKYTKKEAIVATFISVFPLSGVIYYLVAHVYKDYSAFFTSGILLYYVFIYIHMSRIDPLTELLNRQSFYKDISKNAKSITGIVSVDMNNLKYLNDNFGHEAGDKALKTISSVMNKSCGRGGTAYRIGGDEFVILYTNAEEEAIIENIKNMRSGIEEAKYSCAFGYSMKSPDETIKEVLRRSDEKMYINKVEMKAGR